MAPLDRALALAHVHDVAVSVREDLKFDVARPLDVAFEQHAIVAEGAQRFASRRFQFRVEVFEVAHRAHAATAAPGCGFDEHRQADPLRLGAQAVRGLLLTVVSRNDGHAGVAGQLLCPCFIAGRLDRSRGRAYPHQVRVDYGLRERGLFGEETVAGMNRVGSQFARGPQHVFNREIRRARFGPADRRGIVNRIEKACAAVRLGIHAQRHDSGLTGAERHPHHDLAPVGDEEARDRAAHASGFGRQAAGRFSRNARSPS